MFARAIVAIALAASAALPVLAQVNSTENNALIFQVNGTEYARISETSGNLGIGTTNPVATLTVSGNVSVTGMIDVGHTAQACATAISGSIRYETTSDTIQVCTGSGWKSLSSSTTAGTTTTASSTGAIQFNSGNSFAGDTSNLFWDDTNNRLGIGTSDPSKTLHIMGDVEIGGSNTGLIRFRNKADNDHASLGIYGGGLSLSGASGATTAGYQHIYIANSGYVGLQDTAPNTNFVISETTTDVLGQIKVMQHGTGDASLFFGAGGSIWAMGIDNSDSDKFKISTDVISANVGTDTRLTITSGGNVGIATTAPNATLDVSGAIVSRVLNNGSGTSVNFSQSNVAYTSAACGAFTLSNMQDGGSYSLVVKGSGTGPATFTHTGLSVKTTATLTCTSAKHTVFTFLRAGTDLYVAMIAGY